MKSPFEKNLPHESEIEDFERVFRRANDFASEKHSGQIRKGSGEPYVTHPIAVSKLVRVYGGDDDLVNAAILHDTREDCDVDYDEIEELFNGRVADVVTELTNDGELILKHGKANYMSRHLLELSDDALLVKLCDCLHNVLDRPKPGQVERIQDNVRVLQRNRRLKRNLKDLAENILAL